MTLDIRPFHSLGEMKINWLHAHFHFSFANYFNPERMQIGPLCVWNDDRINPDSGFDPHPHENMEIITYVRKGAITHEDSFGNVGRTQAGDIQVMSAGSGIVHGEYNREEEATELFQIWIRPRTNGTEPRWETRPFPKNAKTGQLIPMASGETNMESAIPIDQDATLYAGTLAHGAEIIHKFAESRQAYLVPATGQLEINGSLVNARDGVMVTDETLLEIKVLKDAEIVLVDLPL